MNLQARFKEIYDRVYRLTFSDTGAYELMSMANEACALASQTNAMGIQSPYLHELREIRDRQVRPLIEQELVAEERKRRFEYARINLQVNLKGCYI